MNTPQMQEIVGKHEFNAKQRQVLKSCGNLLAAQQLPVEFYSVLVLLKHLNTREAFEILDIFSQLEYSPSLILANPWLLKNARCMLWVTSNVFSCNSPQETLSLIKLAGLQGTLQSQILQLEIATSDPLFVQWIDLVTDFDTVFKRISFLAMPRLLQLVEISHLEKILQYLTDIHSRSNWGYHLTLIAHLLENIKVTDQVITQATQIIATLLRFRDDASYLSSFPYKSELDKALSACLHVVGIQIFVQVCPINLFDTPHRPWVLSIMIQALEVSRPFTHSLTWTAQMLTLANTVFEKAAGYKAAAKSMDAKLYETIGLQIWSLLPLVCRSVPTDAAQGLATLAPVFGSILQTSPDDLFPGMHVDLRSEVCSCLNGYIVSFASDRETTVKSALSGDVAMLANAAVEESPEVKMLVNYAFRFLAALCNLYTTPDPLSLDRTNIQTVYEQSLSMYEKTIRALLPFATPEQLEQLFLNLVKTLLKDTNTQMDQLRLYAVLDLCLLMVPYMNNTRNLSVFSEILLRLLKGSDTTVQKKTYKCLCLFVESMDSVVLVEALLANTFQCKARITLINSLILHLDQERKVEVIPEFISEILLAVKQPNEKCRELAFKCIADMFTSIPAQVFLMITAGIQGSSSMQSATLSVLGRLVYDLESEFTEEMMSTTLEMTIECLDSTDTQVLKSSLGLVKVLMVTLDPSAYSIDVIIPKLMKHASQKSKFKVKVRHLIERFVRKFGPEQVMKHMPVKDHKLVANIQKRRDQLKKKQKQQKGAKKENAKAEANQKSSKKAMMDSDSELGSSGESDDDEPEVLKQQRPKHQAEVCIRDSESHIVDFMDPSSMSAMHNPQVRNRNAKTAFETNNGKIIVSEPTNADNTKMEVDEEQDNAGSAYIDSIENNELAFVRRPDGRIKFKNALKSDWQVKKTGPRKQADEIPGIQYKAKKASGDVKRQGQALPHAYIPLKMSGKGDK